MGALSGISFFLLVPACSCRRSSNTRQVPVSTYSLGSVDSLRALFNYLVRSHNYLVLTHAEDHDSLMTELMKQITYHNTIHMQYVVCKKIGSIAGSQALLLHIRHKAHGQYTPDPWSLPPPDSRGLCGRGRLLAYRSAKLLDCPATPTGTGPPQLVASI